MCASVICSTDYLVIGRASEIAAITKARTAAHTYSEKGVVIPRRAFDLVVWSWPSESA